MIFFVNVNFEIMVSVIIVSLQRIPLKSHTATFDYINRKLWRL